MDSKIGINEVTHEMTMNVTVIGYRGWLIRMRIALWLIRLACWIAGMGFHFEGLKDV